MRGANTSLVEDLRIRIYTIAGRLVRELDLLQDPSLLQNGALKMDWNKVKWNGLDEFGDTLPTGTYLYKVAFRTNEGAQQANQNPIEKLVIIR
jgi:flagellar hook assembly protein FlgD